MNQNIPIGSALAEAKWEAYNEWDMPDDARDEPDGPAFHLFGDPAFEPYKPGKEYQDENKFDIIIDYEKPKTGKSVEVTVEIMDLETRQIITDASITAKFENKIYSGSEFKITAPDDEGSYQMEISVNKNGYQQIKTKFWVNVEKSTTKGVIPGFEAGFIVLAASFIMFAIYKKQLIPKRR